MSGWDIRLVEPASLIEKEKQMAVTTFQDLALADRDRHWDSATAEKRVRQWGEEPSCQVLLEDGRRAPVERVIEPALRGAIRRPSH